MIMARDNQDQKNEHKVLFFGQWENEVVHRRQVQLL